MNWSMNLLPDNDTSHKRVAQNNVSGMSDSRGVVGGGGGGAMMGNGGGDVYGDGGGDEPSGVDGGGGGAEAAGATTLVRGNDYVARYPIVSMVGVGKCVYRIMKYNEDQRKRRYRSNGLDEFWRPFVKEYFAPKSNLLIDVFNKETDSSRSIELPAELIARILKVKYDSGVTEERLLLENPCEFLLHNGVIVVDCPRATIITMFAETMVLTDGHLRVSFSSSYKILCWEFSTRMHEEVARISSERVPRPSANEYGVPAAVYRYMQIAEAVHKMIGDVSHSLKMNTRHGSTDALSESLDAGAGGGGAAELGRRMGAGDDHLPMDMNV